MQTNQKVALIDSKQQNVKHVNGMYEISALVTISGSVVTLIRIKREIVFAKQPTGI